MALVNDTAEYVPTTGAPDNYNADIRPGLGLTYSDARFGETVRQLTNIGAVAHASQNYAHCMINADGTRYFYGNEIRNFSDGSLVESSITTGTWISDCIWHPTDPTKYFYWIQSGGSRGLWERVVNGSSTLIKNFGADIDAVADGLSTLGGSHNYCDKTGRYFVFSTSAGGQIYDRTEDAIYTGAVTVPQGGGWAAITPDGSYYITSDGAFTSYPINHSTNTLSTSGTICWDFGGDHGMLVSASDGNNYVISSESSDFGGLWRVNVTTNNSGKTAAQQRASATQLLDYDDALWDDMDSLMTHGPNGSGQDWVMSATVRYKDNNSELFDATPSGATWFPYLGEIIAINILTGTIRRLAYHRSRNILSTSWGRYVRPTAAWNGSSVMWNSNMNQNQSIGSGGNNEYADLFGIANPLGTTSTTTMGNRGGIRRIRMGLLR